MSHLVENKESTLHSDLGSLGACMENKPNLKLGVRRAAPLPWLL